MKKILSILFVLALVLSFSMVSTTPVAAVTAVPPGVGTILAAVQASLPNDILQLTPGGLYIEPQITIPHNLTIIGGSPKAVINPAGNLIGTGSAQAWILVNPGVTFTLRDVELNGGSLFVTQAIRNHGFTTVDSVDFRNIQSSTSGSPYTGMGIVSFGGIVVGGMGSDTHGGGGGAASTLVVTDSTFAQIGRIGVMVKGTQSTATVSGCTYTGRGSGDWLDYGVEVGAGGTGTITDNVFTNCGTSTTAWASAGVLVTDFYGSGSAATITYNTFTNNQYGVAAGYGAADASVIAVNFNSFSGNTVGIRSPSTVATVDATLNWWGDASGPSGQGQGTGDAVSMNVDFMPWLMEEDGTDTTETNTAPGLDASASTTNVAATATGGNAGTTVTVGEYVGNPTGASPGFRSGAVYIDVHVGGPAPLPTQLVVEVACPGGICSGVVLQWWNGTAWVPVVAPTSVVSGNIQVVLSATSSPTIAQLTGTILGLGGLSTVGWEGSSVDKAAVMVPWIALMAAMMAGATLLVVRRRRAQI